MLKWLFAIATSLSACIDSSATPCGTGVCSSFLVCGPQQQCLLPGQLDACINKIDGDGCSYSAVAEGVCAGMVCLSAGCGNGVTETAEACDDGNRVSFDGCSADCTSTEVCGDGIVDRMLREDCDCGDGSTAVPGCVGPNANTSGATCRVDCKLGRCGDGVLDPGEACDDQNNIPGDGCRADCAGRWTMMNSGTYLDLFDVWGSSATDVYAVGFSRLLHYDGLTWTSVALPSNMTSSLLYRISGSGPNDVHIAAGNTLYHFDGVSWTWVDVGAFVDTLWVSTATRGWAGGNDSGAVRHLYEWDGSTWSERTLPTAMGKVSDLWGAGATFYAVTESGELWKLTGSTWDQVFDADNNPILAEVVGGSSANDVYALGLTGGTHVSHFDGTTWQHTACCDDFSGFDVVVAASDEVLLLNNGSVLTFDGTRWATQPTYTYLPSAAAWIFSRGHAFIVGRDGTILY